MGAEVIRLESPDNPCLNRVLPPYADGIEGPNRAGAFNQFNQSKRSMSLNLKHADGQQLIHDLVRVSDVVVENFAVGVVDRLGMGWETVSQINPRIVMASISGYGQTGPYRTYAAFGQPILMFSGLASLTGYDEGDYRGTGTSYPDPNAALHAAFAVLAGLWERNRSGKGQYIDVALSESFLQVVAEGILPYTMRGEQLAPRGSRDPLMAPHGVYASAGDNRWLTIAVRTEEEWNSFASVVGEPLASDARFDSLAGRKQHEDALDELVEAWTRARDAQDATVELQAVGVAAFPVQNMGDFADDEHLWARDYFTQHDHPETGKYQHTGVPWTYSETPGVLRHAPRLGEANEYVTRELLGRSADEYERLVSENVLR
jgi:benzylsuccinate CoA-transferase BbsF subunit